MTTGADPPAERDLGALASKLHEQLAEQFLLCNSRVCYRTTIRPITVELVGDPAVPHFVFDVLHQRKDEGVVVPKVREFVYNFLAAPENSNYRADINFTLKNNESEKN